MGSERPSVGSLEMPVLSHLPVAPGTSGVDNTFVSLKPRNKRGFPLSLSTKGSGSRWTCPPRVPTTDRRARAVVCWDLCVLTCTPTTGTCSGLVPPLQTQLQTAPNAYVPLHVPLEACPLAMCPPGGVLPGGVSESLPRRGLHVASLEETACHLSGLSPCVVLTAKAWAPPRDTGTWGGGSSRE